MKLLYKERRDCLVHTLNAEMSETLQVAGSQAGMHLVALPRGHDDSEIAKKAAERGISVMPLSSCYLHRAKRKGLILGYGATYPHQIRQAIRVLKTIIET